MRCVKSKKLYNMATVLLQICNGTNKCCKKFIILYSLFSLLSLLSLHFFFSLLSHSSVPSLFGGEASETDTCQEQNSDADSDYRRAYPL